jgi:hypothetical protein
LPTIAFASFGCSNKNSESFAATADSTTPFTSDETSFSLVCEENLGSGSLTERMAVSLRANRRP